MYSTASSEAPPNILTKAMDAYFFSRMRCVLYAAALEDNGEYR